MTENKVAVKIVQFRRREEVSVTIERVWLDAMQGERRSHSLAMATTNNAAVCLPDVIQVLQLFMNDSLKMLCNTYYTYSRMGNNFHAKWTDGRA